MEVLIVFVCIYELVMEVLLVFVWELELFFLDMIWLWLECV